MKENEITDVLNEQKVEDTVEDTGIEPSAEGTDSADVNTENDGDVKDTEATPAEALKAEILALKEKISELEAERDTQARLVREMSDFSALFPEVDVKCIPDSVWDQVKSGTPLAASYALYEKRIRAEEAKISRINASNATHSAGVAGKDTASEYFSPDEVRKMSPAEVHANYRKIKESMKKWI